MIEFRNLESDDRVDVLFRGRDFQSILKVIRSQPHSFWDKKSRKWTLPLLHLLHFVGDLYASRIDDTVFWESKVYEAFLEFRNIVKRQNEIKSLPLKLNLKRYNKYLNEGISLRPFQTLGSHFLYNSRLVGGCLLADVVGIGKTPQSIVASHKLLVKKEVDNVIVICPESLKRKWYNDIHKFLKEPDALMIDGVPGKRLEQYQEFAVTKGSYLIVNYDIAKNDWESILFPILKDNDKLICCIFDEAQALKNYTTKRSKLCGRLAREFSSVNYGLTATYYETSLMDIFNIFTVVNTNTFGVNAKLFIENYVVLDYMGKEKGPKNVESLKKRLSPYHIRRQKEQVLDQLPERIEDTYWVKLTGSHLQCYKEIEASVIDNIKSELRKQKVSTANILAQQNYLLQSCLSPELVSYKNPASLKIDLLLELLDQFADEKVLVFCKYARMVDILFREIKKKGYGCFKAKGKGSDGLKNANQKQELIDKFNSDDTKVLVSTDVFKEGVDIVGASIVIHFDLLWNPATMEQRSGRIDRIGQKANKIYSIRLITEDTIEHQMWERLYERGETFNDVVDLGFKSKRVKQRDLLGMLNIEQ